MERVRSCCVHVFLVYLYIIWIILLDFELSNKIFSLLLYEHQHHVLITLKVSPEFSITIKMQVKNRSFPCTSRD